MSRRVALYTRVSTDKTQAVEAQRGALYSVAARLGWVVEAAGTNIR